MVSSILKKVLRYFRILSLKFKRRWSNYMMEIDPHRFPKTYSYIEREANSILDQWTPEEIKRAYLRAIVESPSVSSERMYMYMADNQRMKSLFKADFVTDKSMGHLMHVADLESKIKRQKAELKSNQRLMRDYKIAANSFDIIIRLSVTRTNPFTFDPAEVTIENVEFIELLSKEIRKNYDLTLS